MIPTKTLPSGFPIPVIGLGVYKAEPGAGAYNAVLSALTLGYRHIDTAQFYQNEADVGRAIRDSGIPRDEIFVTSKLFIDNWGYERQCPAATRDETWRALEGLQQHSILKDIGVSNFGESHLEKFLKTVKVKPAVNQLELHPWLMRPSLVKYCKEHEILLQAYSPLARARKLEDPTVLEIANEVGVTPAQVLVAFSLANDFITLPKSVSPARQKANLEAVNIKLSTDQVAKLAALDEELVVAWRSQDPIEECEV